MSKTSIVVASAVRTPVGSFNGAFAATPAHELGAVVIKELLSRAGVEPGQVDEVILGQVLTAAQGQNPARQASINAGLPKETTAWGLNQVCGSGLRAIALGMQQIAAGDAKLIIAGGQESMSLSAHAQHLRAGVKMGDFKLIDTMIKDGLWDAFNGYHMGNTAENVARQFQITRDDQDQFALASQNKAEAAQKAGKLKDEIVAFTIKGRKGARYSSWSGGSGEAAFSTTAPSSVTPQSAAMRRGVIDKVDHNVPPISGTSAHGPRRLLGRPGSIRLCRPTIKGRTRRPSFQIGCPNGRLLRGRGFNKPPSPSVVRSGR
ncbi:MULTISPECIES: hypothetical protein [Mesorhizobium]|uniref:thiolase family protein n=1 Tax=Mesorhizobium TaxID=68287 RepID=UPI001FCE9064|nr:MULTISPECIES: hypothetical protein [Mesorhizobium]